MIEAIGVVRDIVIILSAIIITVVVVIVGRMLLELSQKADDLRLFVENLVTGVVNPIRGMLLAISRRHRR